MPNLSMFGRRLLTRGRDRLIACVRGQGSRVTNVGGRFDFYESTKETVAFPGESCPQLSVLPASSQPQTRGRQ